MILRTGYSYCATCNWHWTVEVSADLLLVPARLHEHIIREAQLRADYELHEHWLERHAHIQDTPRGRLAWLTDPRVIAAGGPWFRSPTQDKEKP